MKRLIAALLAIFLTPAAGAVDTEIAGYSKPPAVALFDLPDAAFGVQPNETPQAYAQRVNRLVHLSTYHCGANEMPLGPVSGLLSGRFFAEGLLDFERFVCGLCHQRAYMLTKVMEHPGIADEVVLAFDGHVVVSVLMDGEQYLIDPDYGVGPILWAADPEDRRVAVLQAYTEVEWADVALVSDILLNSDPSPYYVDLTSLERLQKTTFLADSVVSSPVAWAALTLVFGAAYVGRRRRTQKTS